jgi:tetratricopeptide (TPR) repeat protein
MWFWGLSVIRLWFLALALAGAAGLMSTDASAYSKAAVSACQRASEDGDGRRTIAECGNLINAPGVPAAEKAMALVNRCIAYYYQDDDERAIEDCTAALQLVPNDARAFEYRGRSYNARYQYDDAMRDYDRAIELDPVDSDLRIIRGFAHYNRGNLDAALQDYEQAVKNGGDKGWIYYRRGTALLAKGETQRAMADYAQSIPLNAEETPGYAANASFYLGQYAQAATYFSQVTEPDPYDAFFHYLSRRHAGRADAAEVFEAVAAQLQGWPDQLARYFQGETSKVDLLKAAADPDPKTAAWQLCEAEFYVGEVELIAGNKDEARQRFETAVKICPKDFLELIAARAELTRL